MRSSSASVVGGALVVGVSSGLQGCIMLCDDACGLGEEGVIPVLCALCSDEVVMQ